MPKPKISPQMRESFVHFSRNGRWGTCSACPIDALGYAYPEFCEYTDRYDHQLTIEKLVETHRIYLRNLKDKP